VNLSSTASNELYSKKGFQGNRHKRPLTTKNIHHQSNFKNNLYKDLNSGSQFKITGNKVNNNLGINQDDSNKNSTAEFKINKELNNSTVDIKLLNQMAHA
jgi:hypothetical protein